MNVDSSPLRFLILEDQEDDAELMVRELQRTGIALKWTRVDTRAAYSAGLDSAPDFILADYTLPRFTALDALRILREKSLDIPFIIVTGAIGEEAAVECMKLGADDYLLKDRLARLGKAVMASLERKRLREESRRSREALQSLERRYQELFNRIDTCVAVYKVEKGGEDFTILDFNPAAERAEGVSRNEILGHRLTDAFPGVREFGLLDVFRRVWETDAPEHHPASFYKDSKRAGWRENYVYKLPTGEIVAAYHDLTEHMRMENALLRLNAAIEHAPDAVIVTDPRGSITYVNSAFESITGYTKAEAVGRNPRLLKSGRHDASFYQGLWDRIISGQVWRGRLVNRRKDESLYQEEKTIAPIFDRAGITTGFVGIGRDMTEQAKLEENLRQMQKMEAVGELASGVAHDFNNMLQVIGGYLEMLRLKGGARGETGTYIDQIQKATNHAAGLTRQLLAFSRKQALQLQILNPNDVVANLIKMIRRVIGENIRLEFLPGAGVPAVLADEGQLEQVLLNLCLNSRDAMPSGGTLTIETGQQEVDDEFRAVHPWAKLGRYFLLTISDTGHGMDKATLGRIFDPFFTTKEKGKGTGLGLAVVYGIVKQHDGMIDAYSEPGIGTTFRILLPASKTSVGAKTPGSRETVTGGSETILFAEDDESIRSLVVTALEDVGYQVLAAVDGNDALATLERNAATVSLAILDAVMPGISGEELYDRVTAVRRDLPVLFCSGYSPLTHQTRFIREQGIELLQKPYALAELLRRIRRLLEKGARRK